MSIEHIETARLRKDGENWVVITHAALKALTSADAAAAYLHLQSKPDGWVVRRTELQQRWGWGRERAQKALKFLRDVGLSDYEVVRNEHGQITDRRIVIYAKPRSVNREPENPAHGTESRKNRSLVKPHDGKTGPLVINDLSSNKGFISNKGNTQPKKHKGIELDTLPPEVSEHVAKEFIDHRAKLKKPLTSEAFRRAIKTALAGSQIGLTADQVIIETIDAGWAGVNLQWLKNRLQGNHHANQQSAIRPKSAAGRVAENARRERERLAASCQGAGNQAVGENGPDVWPQVGERVWGGDRPSGNMGQVLEGDCTRSDS